METLKERLQALKEEGDIYARAYDKLVKEFEKLKEGESEEKLK